MSKRFETYGDAFNAIFPILETREDLKPIEGKITEAIYQLFCSSSRKKLFMIADTTRPFIKPHQNTSDSFAGIYLPIYNKKIKRQYMFQLHADNIIGNSFLTIELLGDRCCAEWRPDKM